MKKKDAIKHFGGAAQVAQALKISRQAVYQWPDIVPIRMAIRLNNLTAGDISVRLKDYK